MKQLLICLIICLSNPVSAQKTVNIYAWGGEIPAGILRQFEQESHIQVNFSTYDSNETLYAKLKAGGLGVYDVILPSAYYVERMRKQGMLERLDHKKIPNYTNLMTEFTQLAYDRDNHYSMPLIWGITGLFYPKNTKPTPEKWQDLWHARWHHQLVLLDDAREVFSMALLALGYSANDSNPQHIKTAYEHLLTLKANIRLFASDNVQSIIIDEDAKAGMVWNGDAFKAQAENANIAFAFPQEGYVMWVDCLAIPKHAPHREAAYKFINYLLSQQAGKKIALAEGHAITNAKARQALPKAIRNNPLIYPSKAVLAKAQVQRDVSSETLALYSRYWQQLKLSF